MGYSAGVPAEAVLRFRLMVTRGPDRHAAIKLQGLIGATNVAKLGNIESSKPRSLRPAERKRRSKVTKHIQALFAAKREQNLLIDINCTLILIAAKPQLLYTGQRASDAKSMLWQDVENSAIRVVQGKTGAKRRIPLHPELARLLAAWPKTNLVMLTTTSAGRKLASRIARHAIVLMG
jgi:integrase